MLSLRFYLELLLLEAGIKLYPYLVLSAPESTGKRMLICCRIRLKIWKIATKACDGRIIQVNVKNLLTKYSEHPRGVLYNSATPIPGVLHVCSESREMALHRYQLAMTTFASGPRIYVDFSSDTIYFGEGKSPTCNLVFSTMILEFIQPHQVVKYPTNQHLHEIVLVVIFLQHKHT